MEATARGPWHVVPSSGATPMRSGCWAKGHCDFLLDAIDAQLRHLQAQGPPVKMSGSDGAVQGMVVVCDPTGSTGSAVEDSRLEEGAQEEVRGFDLEGDQSRSDSVCTEELATMFQAGLVDLRLNSESEGEENTISQHPSTIPTRALVKEWGQAAWSPSSKEPPSHCRMGSLSSLGDKITSLSQTDVNKVTMETFGHHPSWRKGHQPMDSRDWDSLAADDGGKASWQRSKSFETLLEWVQALHKNPSRPLLEGDLDPLEMDVPPIKKPMSDGASVDLGGRGDKLELTKGQRHSQLRTACGMMSHKEASRLASERKALEVHVQQLEAQLSSLKLQLRNSKIQLATLKEMASKTKQIQEAVLLEKEEELSRLREIVEALGVKSEAQSRAVARLEQEKVSQVEALRQEAQREKEKDLLRVQEELRREKQQALQELAEKMEQASTRALWEQSARFRLEAEDLHKAIGERDAQLLHQEDAQWQKAKALKQEAEEMVQKALLREWERWEADTRAALWALREQNQKALLRLQEALEEERRANRALWETAGSLHPISIPGREQADTPVPRALWPLEGHPTWKAQLALEFKEELKAEMEKRRSRDKPLASCKEREMPLSEMYPVSEGNGFHSPWLSAMLSSQWPFATPNLLGRLQSRIRERRTENAACCCVNQETVGSFQDDRGKSCAS